MEGRGDGEEDGEEGRLRWRGGVVLVGCIGRLNYFYHGRINPNKNVWTN